MFDDTNPEMIGLYDERKETLDQNIKKMGNEVIGYLKNMTGDITLSLDLAQETFLRSLDFLSRQTDILSAKPYLLKVARNLAIDNYRKFGKRSDLFGEERETVSDKDQERFPSPEYLVIEKEKKDTILRYFAALKERDREILTLYYYNDLNLSEIAGLLDIPINTAITRLARARREIKIRILKDKNDEMSK